MQSRLYFSRLGRATLHHGSLSLALFSNPLPTLPVTTKTSRALYHKLQIVHSVVKGVAGLSDCYKGNEFRWTKGNTPEGDSRSAASSRNYTTPPGRRAALNPRLGQQKKMFEGPESSAVPSKYTVSRLSLWRSQVRPGSVTPPLALGHYLDLEDAVEKQDYWRKVRHVLPHKSLPTMVLHHLYISSIPKDDWEYNDYAFRDRALAYLRSRGLGTADVERWGWILTGDASDISIIQTADQMVNRLLSISSDQPTFLLLQVLRKDVQHVENLRKLILHAWDRCEKFNWPVDSAELDSLTSDLCRIRDNEFEIVVSRLLYQARRIWPAGTLGVVQLVSRFVQSLNDHPSSDRAFSNQRNLSRSCHIVNNVLRRLALPASTEPLKSMVHNWSSQKVLLNLAGQLDPALNLDHGSYRAVIQVLTASQKVERESKAATLRLRTWPPWRIEQDGMDAQRTLDDDLSRAMLAAIRAMEAGFRRTSHDQRMQILGGQEPDGTPTIHTRKVVKWRRPAPSEGSKASAELCENENMSACLNLHDSLVWAARVEATRDVREAWRAFVAFVERGGKPTSSLYLAMFKKLNFEKARRGRRRNFEAAPGDGKEVLAVPDDNMSEFYKSHSQPPPLGTLYKEMLLSGIRPQGQCLLFLLRHARTSTAGIKYLRDSGLDPLVLRYWTGGNDTSTSPSQRPPPNVLKNVSHRVLGAFLHLICRFAPRAVLSTSDEYTRYKLRPIRQETPGPNGWAVMELESTPYQRLRDPLRQAARLLKNEKVMFRPAWYCLFRALGRRNILLRRSLIGDPEHDALAWRFTVAVLRNFHTCGLELDPHGFLLICNVFFKYAEATHDSPLQHEAELNRGAQLLKDEFVRLSRSASLPFCKPTLLHSVRWVTLHNYVRCMGIIGDCNEIISILEWMVQHRDELEECNSQDRNGKVMLSRTLVAARISCYGTEYERKGMELVKQVDSWKWPDDDDLGQYTGSLATEREDTSVLGEDIYEAREA